jgi:hypothetical protein
MNESRILRVGYPKTYVAGFLTTKNSDNGKTAKKYAFSGLGVILVKARRCSYVVS